MARLPIALLFFCLLAAVYCDDAPDDDMDDYGGGGGYGSGGYGGGGYGGGGYDDYGGGGGPPPGPASEALETKEDLEKFLADSEASVVGFFTCNPSEEEDAKDKCEDNDSYKTFMETAEANQYNHRFAHTTDAATLEAYKYKKGAVVVFKSAHYVSEKYGDKKKARYPSAVLNKGGIEKFVKEHSYTLVNQMSYKNKESFTSKGPVVVVFFDIDFEKNLKGTNYYINRIRKVATEYKGKVSFLTAPISEFSYEAEDYGLKLEANKKQVAVGLVDDGKHYKMDADFSVDNIKQFVLDFYDDKLEEQKRPEPVDPDDVADDDVTVLSKDNFEAEVTDDKDAMLEFYAPWCGHCKSLKPEYAKLGTHFKDNDKIVIGKFDATASDPPAGYDLQGYPTIYFKAAGGKPVSYDGAREADGMIEYVKSIAVNK